MKRISLKYVLSILAVLLVNIIVIVLLTQYVGAKVKAEDSDTSESTSTGETTAVFSNLGSRGEEVRQIQTKLKELGYLQGNVDGIYGTQTVNAVKYFQRKNGLTVDGIAGPATLKAMGINSSSSSSSSSSNSSDINLLSRIIYSESRGEPYAGQVAVGAVVLNRVKSSSFPNSIAGVIYQSGAFDAVSDGQINLTPNSTAKKAAQDALNGWDPSYGAIYYFNPSTATNKWIWSRPMTVTIGKHRFCK